MQFIVQRTLPINGFWNSENKMDVVTPTYLLPHTSSHQGVERVHQDMHMICEETLS